MTSETESTTTRPITDDHDVDASDGHGKPDFHVGYRKPPKTHQFKKGRSGNPSGRKKTKKITDIRGLLDGILEEQVQVRDGQQIRSVSSLEAVMQAYRLEALKGDTKAARNLFKLADKAGLLSAVVPVSFIKLMEPGGDDGKVIRMYHAEQETLSRKAGRNEKESSQHRNHSIGMDSRRGRQA